MICYRLKTSIRFHPEERMVKTVKATRETTLLQRNVADENPEFMMEFLEAIQNPELRKEIIDVLESAGLLPLSDRQLA